MTLDPLEYKPIPSSKDSEASNLVYLPLDAIVREYDDEIERGLAELQDILLEIEYVRIQLHKCQLRHDDMREIAAINLGVDDQSVTVSLSAKECLTKSTLLARLNKLEVVYERMKLSVEESRVAKIRHEEAIESRLFQPFTTDNY